MTIQGCKSVVVTLALMVTFLLPLTAAALFQGGPGEGARWPSTTSDKTAIPICFRTTGTQSSDRQGNPYVVSYSGAELAQKQQLVRDALEDSWQKWTGIVFQGWGNCSSNLDGYVYVDLIKEDCGGCGDSIPRGYSAKGVKVWLKLENPDERLMRTVIMHEFGHVLGFHHEMDRPDAKNSAGSFLCKDGPVEYTEGTYLTPYYDDPSIMNYCAPRNRNGLSGGDIEGVEGLYGISKQGRWLKTLPSLFIITM